MHNNTMAQYSGLHKFQIHDSVRQVQQIKKKIMTINTKGGLHK